ncbi:hypothetical protein Tco_1079918 [Tanacetum coccineum]|uniref:Uncharacterized protein n=1 Tax=Tanacetum coccineum TaxID=301880 RepID=A0ABQ5HV75_9ASTR
MLKVNASRRGLFPHAISVNPFDDSLIAVFGKYVKLDVVSLREDNEQSMEMDMWEIKEKLAKRREQMAIRAYEENRRREELNQKIEEWNRRKE